MSGYTLFRTFKYVLFGLFTVNLVYYLGEDLDAFHYLPDDATLDQIFSSFAVTIDFVAWMILIVVFELETDALSQEQLQGRSRWVFRGIVAACYSVLLYAFYGYVVALVDFSDRYDPIPSETICELVDQDFAFLSMEARYLPLDESSCAALSGGAVFKHQTDKVVASAAPLAASVKLAWIDVANAAAWLLIVLLFEIEVICQARGTMTQRALIIIKASKGVLYLTLLGNAIYWTVYGAFIDYWDAYLWLAAFVLIDLNVFNFEARSSADSTLAITAGGDSLPHEGQKGRG